MSEEQLSTLLAKLKVDASLQEKFKNCTDLNAAVEFARDAGFDVSKADWVRLQAKQTLDLCDEELERVAGGVWPTFDYANSCAASCGNVSKCVYHCGG